jgi:glycerol-3-phosphate O-acyltransferase / dihydroxyacetone phosphate acyltransferase
MAYRVIRALARLLLSLFYRRIEVVGREHIPARAPVIIAANHNNALVDPMLVMATVPRELVVLAAAPLFRNPVIGPFLRLVGALPVLRRQEGIADPARNEAMFATVAATLAAGGAVLLFPEGRTQPEPVLLPLRTGAARMLLAAASDDEPVTLLPVGLVFHEPGTFRTGWALVLIGPPVETADCVALHRTDPDGAVHELTERLAEALRRQIVEADDRQTLRLMRVAETLWRGETPAVEEPARVRALQQIARAYRRLQDLAPERVAALRQRIETYSKDLELSGLTERELSATYPPGVVLRWTVREGLSLLLGLPLALCGMILHAIPYQLTRRVVRALDRSAEEEATDKIVAGSVLYPLVWGGESWLAWRLGGGWAVTALLAALLPTGFFALAWQERLDRATREARAFLRLLGDRDLRRRLIARRRALVDELTALTRVVESAGASAEPGD